jgi:eukaryotic-like serine/threonine-protein kinase
MNPAVIDRLKNALVALNPGLTFGEYLGEGAFSIVYAAKVRNVDCAIKFSKKSWDRDAGVNKERQSLLSLVLQCNGHPHIASLIDYWDGDEVDHHLVTRWKLGEQSLAERLQQCQGNDPPGIPRDELLRYVRQTAEGLDYIHDGGIVHRDIKPENLLLFRGQVKIVDLGFARLAELDSQTNSVLGTPIYAPPEAFNQRLQNTVDIYCLAGTYIRLRTGQFPFGGDAHQILRRKRKNEFETSGLNPWEIEALYPALMADPEQRGFSTCDCWRIPEFYRRDGIQRNL